MKRQEQADQIALIRWAEYVTVGSWKLSDLLWHYPAGGWRSPVEASILKSMGTQDGVPDLFLPLSNADYHAGWWELKTGRNPLSPAQAQKHTLLRALGHRVQTYWHWAEAANDMLRYLGTTRYIVVSRARL